MKVYQTYDIITDEPTGMFYPGIVIEHAAAEQRLLLLGMTARPLDEAVKVERMMVKRGVGNLFSAYVECDEPTCQCYGSKWYVLYCDSVQVMGPGYKEHIDKVMDDTRDERKLYELPFADGEVDRTKVDITKLF